MSETKVIKFKNFSDEDFSWKWNGDLYTFKAGQEIYMEDFKSEHFAKHLIDRELDKDGKRTNDMKAREALSLKCLFPEPSIQSKEIIDENSKKAERESSMEISSEIVPPKRKQGRPKKVVEEEFEGLNDKQ